MEISIRKYKLQNKSTNNSPNENKPLYIIIYNTHVPYPEKASILYFTH